MKKIHRLANLYKVNKKIQEIINLYATYINSQTRLEVRVLYCHLGGFVNVEFLSENHHKISFIAREDLY
jgi:hypothetical protein